MPARTKSTKKPAEKTTEIVGTPTPVDEPVVEAKPVVVDASPEPSVEVPSFISDKDVIDTFKDLAFKASSASLRVKDWSELKSRKVLTRSQVHRIVTDVILDSNDKSAVDAFFVWWKKHKIQLKAAGAAVSQRISPASPVFAASLWSAA